MALPAAAAVAVSASASLSAASPLRVAVVGGSIGGLAAATAFLRLGAHVRVYEKSATDFVGRGGSIGYCNVPLWERLRGAQMLRRGRQASREQGAFLYGDLWNFFASGLPPGVISYASPVLDLGDDVLRPTVNGEAFDLAIVADGGWSQLRSRYFGPAKPQYAGWQAWRFRVRMSDVPGFEAYGQYNDGGYYDTILLDVAMDNGEDWVMGGTSVPAPESDIVAPAAGANRQTGATGSTAEAPAETLPEWFLPLYRKNFGSVARGELYRAMEAAARKGKISPNPQFEFAAERIVRGRIVLVGDAAHMAVPRTASGAHTAVLDGMALLEAFHNVKANSSGSWAAAVDRALAAYEPHALQRAHALYARSLEVSAQVLPPGFSREASRLTPTAESTAAMTVRELKGELLARRVPLAGLAEKADLVRALLEAAAASANNRTS